jgi:hypothetical protein
MADTIDTPNAEPADAKAGPSVIRLVQGAEETAQERLLKKQVPAWVISGAFHVVVLIALIVIGRMQPTRAEAPQTIQEAVLDKPPEEDKTLDLTNPDKGLDSELANALPVDRVEDVTVDAKVNPDQPIGVDDNSTNPTDVAALAGLGTGEQLGVLGTEGNVTGGNKGAGGTGTAGFAGRSGATKEKNLLSGGGNSASEAAVARGLLWLDKKQNKTEGQWTYDGSSKGDTVAATGMGLLPFLAAGQTHSKKVDPKSGKDSNKYQKTVELGLKYLIKVQLPTGSFRNAGMYSHAIATVALCEAYGMTGDKSLLLVPAKKAVEFIIKAQASNGSWGYNAGAPGDTSIVGWQIQALQSARMCKDITVPEATLKKAREFLDKVAKGSLKSQYGYSDNNTTTPTLSAVGLLCRYYTDGWGPGNASLIDGVKKLMAAHMPKGNANDTAFNMYYYYYATQVVHFHEGKEWSEIWNPKMRDQLIAMQVGEGKNDAGSWDADRNTIGSHCGRLGTTCLALLSLEVYYRHLPLYKRDTGGLKELERGK